MEVVQAGHRPLSFSPQPNSLTVICLNLVFDRLIALLIGVDHAKESTYVGVEKQLLKLLEFFQKAQISLQDSSPIPSIAPHFIKRLIERYIEYVSLDVANYGPNQLPLLLYVSICYIYSDIRVFGFRSQGRPFDEENQSLPCYHQLTLDNIIELQLIQDYLQPFQAITLLNLTGDSKFTDSDLLGLHNLIGRTVRSIVLDHTSVTDHGIGHLARINSKKNLTPDDECRSDPLLATQESFSLLRMISLRGLNLITDRSAQKLCWFPNLISIDLSGTSCTDATLLIMNKSRAQEYRFRRPRTQLELDLFSTDLKPHQRLSKLFQSDCDRPCDNQNFFFQINRSDRSYRESNTFTHQSNVVPFGLVRNVFDSRSSSRASSMILRDSKPPSSSVSLDDSNENRFIPKIRTKRLHQHIIDDLFEVRKVMKRSSG